MGLATFGEWLVKGMEGALTLTNHVLTAVDGVIAIAGVITNGKLDLIIRLNQGNIDYMVCLLLYQLMLTEGLRRIYKLIDILR